MLFLLTSFVVRSFSMSTTAKETLSDDDGNIVRSIDISGKKEYNGSGIRIGKTVNGVLRTYTLDGTKILRDAWGAMSLIPCTTMRTLYMGLYSQICIAKGCAIRFL